MDASDISGMDDARNLRLLYVSLEALQQGRAAHTHVHQIVDGLRQNRITVSLIAMEQTADIRRTVLSRLADISILLWRAVRQMFACDAIYMRSHPLLFPVAAMARIFGIPVIQEINGSMDDLGVTYALPMRFVRIFKAMQRWQYRMASALVTVTPGLRDWAKKECADLPAGKVPPCSVIPNGGDGRLFFPQASHGPIMKRDYAFFFGGITAWHGIDVMLAALAHPAWPATVDLVIAGDGPASDTLKKSGQADSRLIVLGYSQPQEVAGLCARSLVSLVPITGKGGRADFGVAPIKLFEGMACGRPVIVSDLPYQGDLVREYDCGLVFPADDSASLAHAVRSLSDNRARADAMGIKARKAVETACDWSHRAKDTAHVIRDVVARSRA